MVVSRLSRACAPACIFSASSAALLLVLATVSGCKPKASCQPGEYTIQVVLHPGEPLNPGDNQESLPTTVHVLQLADDDAIGRFDLEAFRADPKVAVGEGYIAHETFSVWPRTDDVRKIRPKGDAQHLMLVAEYRQVLGSGWYATYDIPLQKTHEDAVCTAVKRKKPPIADPCFYALLERYETRGGATPPAGMKGDQVRIRGKAVRCAPPPHQYIIDPKIAKKKNRRKLDPSRIPTSMPRTPNAGSAAGAAPAAAPAGAAPTGANPPTSVPRRPF